MRHRKIVGSEQAALALDSHLKQSAALTRAAFTNYALAETLSLSDALQLWLASFASATRTKAHIADRMKSVVSTTADIPIGQVTPKTLTEWWLKRRAEISPYSLAHDTLTLKRWLGWLTEHGYVVANAAAHLDSKCPQPKAANILSYATEAQALALLLPRTRLRFLLAVDGGLRLGETNALRRNHWNRDERILTVWSTKTRNLRQVPTTRRLQSELLTQAGTLLPDALILQYGSHQIKKGSDFLKKLWPKLGLRFRFHDLRHTFATRCAAAHPNPFTISALLGHTGRSAMLVTSNAVLSATTALYVHPQLPELRKAIEAMEAANPNTQEEGNHDLL